MSTEKELFDILARGHFEMAKKHMEIYHLDPNIKEPLTGFTPIVYGVKAGNAEFVQSMIAQGVDVNQKIHGMSLLHLVRNVDTAQVLIDAGANVNAISPASPGVETAKATPLHHAVLDGNEALAELLLKHGANPDALDMDRNVPLHFAQSERMAAILLEQHANKEIRNRKGISAGDQLAKLQAHIRTEAGHTLDTDNKPVARPSEEEEEPQAAIRRADVQQNEQARSEDASALIRRAELHNHTQQSGKNTPKQLLGGEFIGNDKGEYFRRGESRVALFDDGDQIRFNDKQMDTFRAGVELAQAKGWGAIEVQGNERFRKDAWLHAKAAGLEVIGYEPNAQDLKELATFQVKHSESQRIALEQSLEKAKEFALDNGKSFVSSNVQDGSYSGRVLAETDHHILLSVDGRAGTVTALEKSKLEGIAYKNGEPLKVSFKEGKAIDMGRSKEQKRSMSIA